MNRHRCWASYVLGVGAYVQGNYRRHERAVRRKVIQQTDINSAKDVILDPYLVHTPASTRMIRAPCDSQDPDLCFAIVRQIRVKVAMTTS